MEKTDKYPITLTDSQISHWRVVLSTILGPYALLMTEEEIQRYRDRMQAMVDSMK